MAPERPGPGDAGIILARLRWLQRLGGWGSGVAVGFGRLESRRLSPQGACSFGASPPDSDRRNPTKKQGCFKEVPHRRAAGMIPPETGGGSSIPGANFRNAVSENRLVNSASHGFLRPFEGKLLRRRGDFPVPPSGLAAKKGRRRRGQSRFRSRGDGRGRPQGAPLHRVGIVPVSQKSPTAGPPA